MKRAILVAVCGLSVSLTASAELSKMTESEMSGATTSEIFSNFSAEQATSILKTIATDRSSSAILTDKINAALERVNLEKITVAQVDSLLRRANGVEFSDTVLRNNLQIVNQMMINRQLHDAQVLADMQRRAIIATFFAAAVNSDLQNNRSIGNILSVMSTLNPSQLLAQYPNLISPIYSFGKPNSPNIDIIRNK